MRGQDLRHPTLIAQHPLTTASIAEVHRAGSGRLRLLLLVELFEVEFDIGAINRRRRQFRS